MRSPSLPASPALCSFSRVANRESTVIAAFVIPLSIWASLQVLCVKPDQFSASRSTCDRTRCLIETNNFERGIPTNVESWLIVTDINKAIAYFWVSNLRGGLLRGCESRVQLAWFFLFNSVPTSNRTPITCFWSTRKTPRLLLLDEQALLFSGG